jgi:ABC-type multidrug transport system permease subunit
MRRLYLLLLSELKLTRTSIAVHLIAVFQPTLMYFLMSMILVLPTFDMNIVEPDTAGGTALLAAMGEVGSPHIPYIQPVLVDTLDMASGGQVIEVKTQNGRSTAIQYFDLIDSNLVKNYRNRLTAAALVMWNQELGDRAVMITEYPWLPEDTPYTVFFGMAMLPLTVFLASVMTGGYSTAQDFENDTIREYRLAPTGSMVLLAARMMRLITVGMFSASILLVMLKIMTGKWPESIPGVLVILLPVAIVGGSLGITVGLSLQKTLPTFVIGLTSSFATWILGGAFGLSAGFGHGYQIVSRFMPNTYAVELLFPLYYGPTIGSPRVAILALGAFSAVMLLVVHRAYRLHVASAQG